MTICARHLAISLALGAATAAAQESASPRARDLGIPFEFGIPGRFDDPRFFAALEQVVAAADAAGKATGILLRDAKAVARHLELGFRFIGVGSDGAFVTDGSRAALAASRAALAAARG